MTYTLNGYFNISLRDPNAARVVVYPNDTIAAQLQNYHVGQGMTVIHAADCLAEGCTYLPMPDTVMRSLDAKIQTASGSVLVVGLDAYLALVDARGLQVFLAELRKRLDHGRQEVIYLLSAGNKPCLEPRYEESRSIICIEDDTKETLTELSVYAYPAQWAPTGGAAGYRELLVEMGPYQPSGEHTLALSGLTGGQAGISSAITFVTDIHEAAKRWYGLDGLDGATLERLLAKATESGRSPQKYLETTFGPENLDLHLALKRLLDTTSDELWPGYIWLVRRWLTGESYLARVLSKNVTQETLLWEYVVGSGLAALTEPDGKKHADERAKALKACGYSYEPLIVEFIGQAKSVKAALPFLNCGTYAERVEIIRRASMENLSYGLPKEYADLYPTFARYFSTRYDFENREVAEYFNEYRRLKVADSITDDFVERAYGLSGPTGYPSRNDVIGKLQSQPDTALLVVDAMSVEYMPFLLALAKHLKMNVESYEITEANLPADTKFNPIDWGPARMLPKVKGVDNIAHDGEEKHEKNFPEQNLAGTLQKIESNVMKRVAQGLTQFSRVVVTADHGASRLAMIAHDLNKGETLPWKVKCPPDDWRYTVAPKGVERSSKLENKYFPDSKITYWVVRGYNRLPKRGGKIYAMHGGATLEERLVPVVVFAKNAIAKELTTPQPYTERTAELVDEFDGLI